jgi:hypothetical protein
VVVDLKKEKEEEVHDRPLAAGRPNSPWRVRSVIGGGAQLAESVPDAVLARTGASGHLLLQCESARPDALGPC